MNNDLNDAQLDAALEALARPHPPADHVAQVLARTGPAAGTGGRAGSPSRPSLLWPAASVATAATLFVAAGLAWQVGRMPVALPDAQAARSASGPYQPQVWGAPQEIDLPVLPPQAYWGMDAFVEFARLRPAGRDASPRRPLALGPADDKLASTVDATQTARSASGPYHLPPIELESVAAAPLDVPPLAPLEDIALAEIPLAPIAIDPIAEEEHP